MIDAMPPTEVANAERFERFGLDADAGVVARVRQEFTDWLRRFFTLDDVRRSDMVLAVNEALANAAEFAYVQADRPGTIDFQAEYDASSQTLSVCVEDRGMWRKRQTEPAPRTRGRGIPLMETLSDHAVIEPSTSGTTVKMQWQGVPRR
ncbi:ATP-binding protein [Mycolicibacterium parafortuitum]|uniref:Anti-sigma regulatory factor,serine/threonine protein kinase [Saccharopolyspora erythraea NRRL 2338] n=1 Tax=Mycolicibacterium parafortuitum TaxID=39692 RepID=A0A375YM44_MYCPF|nr:ATP-binding protein [Mycolicibacterium parafortuitum]ORB23585.1 anti-sigma regulatory factor [Mycolicibacterium parafortuitum]SRX82216.1 anti-sigma regulatory factor,serine/threonine protein kinase [Saccharopolyspora erythraea NRRL 2338] [Mycolicibacterium parafortuitum]